MAYIVHNFDRAIREPRHVESGGDCSQDDCVYCGAEIRINYYDGQFRSSSLCHKIKNCPGREGVRKMIEDGYRELERRRRLGRWN